MIISERQQHKPLNGEYDLQHEISQYTHIRVLADQLCMISRHFVSITLAILRVCVTIVVIEPVGLKVQYPPVCKLDMGLYIFDIFKIQTGVDTNCLFLPKASLCPRMHRGSHSL